MGAGNEKADLIPDHPSVASVKCDLGWETPLLKRKENQRATIQFKTGLLLSKDFKNHSSTYTAYVNANIFWRQTFPFAFF